MQFRAQDISDLLGGEIIGNPEVMVDKPSKIEEGTLGSLSFLANDKYEEHIYTSDASVILVDQNFNPKKPIKATLIKVADVYGALSILMEKFAGNVQLQDKGVHELAFIHTNAKIGTEVSIGAFTHIGECKIGEGAQIMSHVSIGQGCVIGKNVRIYPGVKIYHDTIIGNNVILHSNAVIGSDGFGFAKDANGRYKKMEQLGNVIIDDDVEIGANTVVDRASMGSTRLGKGVKLDNLIQIAHNVEVGENTAMAAQSGIAGSTKLGKNCRVGGQVGFVGHLKIADGLQIQAQSGVGGSIKEENAKLFGTPAIEYTSFIRSSVVFKSLPDMAKKLRELEKEILLLKNKLD